MSPERFQQIRDFVTKQWRDLFTEDAAKHARDPVDLGQRVARLMHEHHDEIEDDVAAAIASERW
jgi:hypothetical protein